MVKLKYLKKKKFIDKLKFSFSNLSQLSELLKQEKYNFFNKFKDEFKNLSIEKKVEFLGQLQPGLPSFIIINSLDIQETIDIFSVLNIDSTELLLDKIIDTYTNVTDTFSKPTEEQLNEEQSTNKQSTDEQSTNNQLKHEQCNNKLNGDKIINL